MKKVFKLSMICIISLAVLFAFASCKNEPKPTINISKEYVGNWKDGAISAQVTATNFVLKEGNDVKFDLQSWIDGLSKKTKVEIKTDGDSYSIWEYKGDVPSIKLQLTREAFGEPSLGVSLDGAIYSLNKI